MHIVFAMLLLREWDEVAESALCGKLAGWQAAYPQEKGEDPLQLHKVAELMATVMAWLHLESCEFDCRSAAWSLALPQTTQSYCDRGINCKHTCTHTWAGDSVYTPCCWEVKTHLP